MSRVFSLSVGMVLLVTLVIMCQPLACSTSTSRVAIIIAFRDYSIAQFQELEKAFKEKEILFEVVSTQLGEARSGDHMIKVDHKINNLSVDRFTAVVFVGGFGAVEELIDNAEAIELARQAARQGKIVGGS